MRLQGISDGGDGSHPAWRLSLLDLDCAGNWSWELTQVALRDIARLLSDMERLTWAEIRNLMTGGWRRGAC